VNGNLKQEIDRGIFPAELDVYKARKMPAFDFAGIADLMIVCGYWLVSEMIVPIHEELLLLYLVALTSVMLAAS